jgi:hypothetical protein
MKAVFHELAEFLSIVIAQNKERIRTDQALQGWCWTEKSAPDLTQFHHVPGGHDQIIGHWCGALSGLESGYDIHGNQGIEGEGSHVCANGGSPIQTMHHLSSLMLVEAILKDVGRRLRCAFVARAPTWGQWLPYYCFAFSNWTAAGRNTVAAFSLYEVNTDSRIHLCGLRARQSRSAS